MLFLDINLGNRYGFEVLKEVDCSTLEVVFLTAHEEYAVEAFKVSALDYLLKPIVIDDLQNVLEKFVARSEKAVFNDRLTNFLNNSTSENKFKKIAFPVLNGYSFIKGDEILYCKADGNYTTIFMIDSDFVVSKQIGYVEDLLVNHSFVRAHKSYLVNLDYIKGFSRGKGLILENEIEIPVSKSRIDYVKKLIGMS